MKERKRRTASRIANPAYIGFAKGNDYIIGIRDVTIQSASSRAAYPVEFDADRKLIQK